MGRNQFSCNAAVEVMEVPDQTLSTEAESKQIKVTKKKASILTLRCFAIVLIVNLINDRHQSFHVF